jgi:DNA-binding phage protein
MADIARKTGVSRESLYRTLSRRGNPQFKTVLGVIGALGMRVQIAPVETRPSWASGTVPPRPSALKNN